MRSLSRFIFLLFSAGNVLPRQIILFARLKQQSLSPVNLALVALEPSISF